MKTIFKDGTYERVSNEVGDIRVYNQGWKFVSKNEWKIKVRDYKEPSEEARMVAESSKHALAEVLKGDRRKKYQKPKRS